MQFGNHAQGLVSNRVVKSTACPLTWHQTYDIFLDGSIESWAITSRVIFLETLRRPHQTCFLADPAV